MRLLAVLVAAFAVAWIVGGIVLLFQDWRRVVLWWFFGGASAPSDVFSVGFQVAVGVGLSVLAVRLWKRA